MFNTSKFHSANEARKPAERRVYHNNDFCRPGQEVLPSDRVPGEGGYRLCEVCDDLNGKFAQQTGSASHA